MIFKVFAGIFWIIAFGFTVYGIKQAISHAWIKGFLLGLFHIIVFTVALLFTFTGLVWWQFSNHSFGERVATISFAKDNEGNIKAEIYPVNDGKNWVYDIRGDQWQIDSWQLHWTSIFNGLGVSEGYQLDNLSTSFLDFNVAVNEGSKQYDLAEKKIPFVNISYQNYDWINWIGFARIQKYPSAFYPVAEGALFSITLSEKGVTAEALNDEAKLAIENWQI